MDTVILVSEGFAQLELNGEIVEKIGAGHFIGSAMFLETGHDMPAFTTIKAVDEIRAITWNRSDLRKLAEKDTHFSTAIAATMGLDNTYMLIRSWRRMAGEH